MKNEISTFMKDIINNKHIVKDLLDNKNIQNANINQSINTDLTNINNHWKLINDYMNNVRDTLNDAVHGHDKAKTQIERIIAQWINGEQSGYCFGFEGPPGVGKTSFAKKRLG